MNYKVEYNIDSISEFRKDIDLLGNNLIKLLEEVSVNIYDLEKYFDTPTGRVYKEKFIEYLNKEKKYINDKYLQYGFLVDDIVKTYEEQQSINKKVVGGE